MTLTRPKTIALGLAMMVGLATCTSVETTSAPARQDDLCSIFQQRPGWRDAVQAAAIRWGASVPVQMAIIWRESSFRSSVRPPKKYILGLIPNGHVSSAYGYSQAINGTWDWYREDTGNSGADRTDFADAADFVGWYMAKSRDSSGIAIDDAYNQYLAYHEGHGGFRRGSYRDKGWLLEAAQRVADQAALYRRQFSGCA